MKKLMLLLILICGCNNKSQIGCCPESNKENPNVAIMNEILNKYCLDKEDGRLIVHKVIPDRDFYGQEIKIHYQDIDPFTTKITIHNNWFNHMTSSPMKISKETKHKIRIRSGITYYNCFDYKFVESCENNRNRWIEFDFTNRR